MGANCCVAARDKPLPYQTRFEAPIRRNVRHSPSWSFRWDNRTHIEDIMDNSTHFSCHNSGNIGSEIKSGEETEAEGLSDGGSPLEVFRTSKWRKSAVKTETSGHVKVGDTDLSAESNLSPEDNKYSPKSSGVASASDSKPSLYIPSTPSPSSHRPDPSSSRSRSLPSEATSSRKVRGSPGYQLSRQVSDSRIPNLKSLNENSSPEDRQSFVLSVCSNDLSAGGSQGGSSDGWSMRMFSELVASSQRERWSFDSENPNSNSIKVAQSNNHQPSTSLSTELQSCGVCLKLLKDRSPWTVQKLVASNEIAVVAVLVCGHVYHAECLESLTPEADRYDPPCPVCTHGEKCGSKLLAKAESKARSKISKIAVADADVDLISERQKSGKFPRLGASSSMKNAFSRPFLRRHFSLGSRPPVRSVSETESSSRKKGFWAKARYWRE